MIKKNPEKVIFDKVFGILFYSTKSIDRIGLIDDRMRPFGDFGDNGAALGVAVLILLAQLRGAAVHLGEQSLTAAMMSRAQRLLGNAVTRLPRLSWSTAGTDHSAGAAQPDHDCGDAATAMSARRGESEKRGARIQGILLLKQLAHSFR